MTQQIQYRHVKIIMIIKNNAILPCIQFSLGEVVYFIYIFSYIDTLRAHTSPSLCTTFHIPSSSRTLSL